MGNCIGTSNNKVLSSNDEYQEPQMELPQAFAPNNKLEDVKDVKKKKRVRFMLHEETGDEDQASNRHESKAGVVRVRLVVTQEELKQILDYKKSQSKFTSLEQLLSEMKLRGRSVLEVEKDDENCESGNWSPALESIPEDD